MRGIKCGHHGLFDLGARKSFGAARVARDRSPSSAGRGCSGGSRRSMRGLRVGRSTKNISSKRPLRTSSGGSELMSFAVATTKTRVCFSAIQVRNVPRHAAWSRFRRRRPARPFSISSIHRTQGDMTSAVLQRIAQLAFGFAMVLVVERAEVQAQQRHAENAGGRLCARLLPQPWIPIRRDALWADRGAGVFVAAKRGSSLRQPVLELLRPPTSLNFAVSYSKCRAPPR